MNLENSAKKLNQMTFKFQCLKIWDVDTKKQIKKI
jgi:hypothetical protein